MPAEILAVAVGGCAVLLLLVLLRGPGPHLLVVAATMVGLACWLVATLRRARQERVILVRRASVITCCDAFAAELRAGVGARSALRRACLETPDLMVVARSAELGLDVEAALRLAASRPGLESVRLLAAAWQVAAESGAALADVLDRLADGLRAEEELRVEVRAGLAPARATARMFAFLPVFGVLLGTSIGVDPVGFLLDTSWGLACLVVGIALSVAGVAWVDRIARAAE